MTIKRRAVSASFRRQKFDTRDLLKSPPRVHLSAAHLRASERRGGALALARREARGGGSSTRSREGGGRVRTKKCARRGASGQIFSRAPVPGAPRRGTVMAARSRTIQWEGSELKWLWSPPQAPYGCTSAPQRGKENFGPITHNTRFCTDFQARAGSTCRSRNCAAAAAAAAAVRVLLPRS